MMGPGGGQMGAPQGFGGQMVGRHPMQHTFPEQMQINPYGMANPLAIQQQQQLAVQQRANLAASGMTNPQQLAQLQQQQQ